MSIEQMQMMGRIPPQHIAAEESILSAALLGAAQDVVELVSSGDFYRTAHQTIFSTIEAMVTGKKTVDLVSLVETLRDENKLEGVGGVSYVSRLTNEVPSSASVKGHADIIKQAAQKRAIIKACAETIDRCYVGEGVDEIMGKHDAEFSNIKTHSGQCFKFADFISEHIEEIERRKSTNGLPGIPCGLIDVDKKFGGWQGERLHVIAGRPGMGKTAFGMRVARGAAKMHIPVLQISLEMSKGQLLDRELSCVAGIDGERIQNGDLDHHHWAKICDAASEIHNLPIWVDDAPSCTIKECQSKIRHFHRKHGRCLIIIDYLDYIRGAHSERKDLEIGTITKGLKASAKEHKIPIILFVQLNRECEKRGDNKRPEIRDLRNSGEIEQDADIIGFMYRDEVYNPTDQNKGIAEFIVRKYRQGKPGTIFLTWIDHRTTFESLSRQP